MVWKLKEVLEIRWFIPYQVDSYVWYREYMVLLFYVDDCIMIRPYKDKTDDLHGYLQAGFNIEDDG